MVKKELNKDMYKGKTIRELCYKAYLTNNRIFMLIKAGESSDKNPLKKLRWKRNLIYKSLYEMLEMFVNGKYTDPEVTFQELNDTIKEST